MSELIYTSEVERLKQFKKELQYLQTNYQRIKREHDHEFIAIKNEYIVAHDSDSRKLEEKLRQKNGDLSQFLIRYMGKTR